VLLRAGRAFPLEAAAEEAEALVDLGMATEDACAVVGLAGALTPLVSLRAGSWESAAETRWKGRRRDGMGRIARWESRILMVPGSPYIACVRPSSEPSYGCTQWPMIFIVDLYALSGLLGAMSDWPETRPTPLARW